MRQRFIGLDLAWSPRNNTAAAVIELDENQPAGIVVSWQERLGSDEQVLAFLREMAPPGQPVVLAIDAPLVVPNQTGSRPCDLELTRHFRRYEAGTHPANRTLLGKYGQPPGEIRSENLAHYLETELCFSADPFLTPREPQRMFFECFPHSAQVILFGLNKTLKYKKYKRKMGGEDNRLAELARLRDYMLTLDNEPKLLLPEAITGRELAGLRGSARKAYEDLLDAVVCAYVALYYWWWGTEKCRVFGEAGSGHIVTPYKYD